MDDRPIPIDDVLDAQFERLPPHSIDAEMCCLASIMLDPDMRTKVLPMLDGDAFYITDHRILFETIRQLHADDKPVDAVIVRDELRRLSKLDDIGGTEYLGEILGKIPSAAHGEQYAVMVMAKYALRRIIGSASQAIQRAYTGEQAHGIASDLLASMLGVTARGVADRIVSMRDAVDEFRAGLLSPTRVRRIATGVTDFDEEIGGIPVGEFTILGGRPGMGKSMVAKQFARNIARADGRVGIISIEESRDKITENNAAAISGVPNRKISRNQLSPDERIRVLDALDTIAGLPIFIIDDVCRLSEVEAAITSLRVKHECSVVIVDHMHLIDGEVGRNENSTQEVTKISKRLKAVAKRLKVALVCCVQLNRGNEHRAERPQLKDIRESGSVEQDGDLIILLHREDYYHRDEPDYAFDDTLELLVRKNKHGPAATIGIKVDLETQRILDAHGGDQDDAAARVAEFFGGQ